MISQAKLSREKKCVVKFCPKITKMVYIYIYIKDPKPTYLTNQRRFGDGKRVYVQNWVPLWEADLLPAELLWENQI